MLTMSEERVYYPSDPKLRELAILADAEELLEEAHDLLGGTSLDETAILQWIFGDDIVGDPCALEEYEDAKETLAKGAELRQECTEAQEALETANERIIALEWKLRDIERVLLKGKGSKLDAIAKILAQK